MTSTYTLQRINTHYYTFQFYNLYLPTETREFVQLRMIHHNRSQINLGQAQNDSSPIQLHRVSYSNIPVLEDMCQRLVFQTQSTSCMACKAFTWGPGRSGANALSYTGIQAKGIHEVG